MRILSPVMIERVLVPVVIAAALLMGAAALGDGPGSQAAEAEWPFLQHRGRLANSELFQAAAARSEEVLPLCARRVSRALGVPVEAGAFTYRFTEGAAHDRASTATPAGGGLPFIRLSAEALGGGTATPDELLSHELAHAALDRALGARHALLPDWLREGLAVHAAGQTERKLQRALCWGESGAQPAELAMRLGAGRHGWTDYGLDGLALALLEKQAGAAAIPRLVALLVAGRDWDDALTEVSGLPPSTFLAMARERAYVELSRQAEPFRDVLTAGTAAAAAGRAEEALRELAPLLARADHALWPAAAAVAARCHAALGRPAAAAAVLDRLLATRRLDVEETQLAGLLAASARARSAMDDDLGWAQRCAELRAVRPDALEEAHCEATMKVASMLSAEARVEGH